MDRDGNSIHSEPNKEIPATHRVTTNRRRSRRSRLKPEQWIAILGGIIIPVVVALIPVLAARLQPGPPPTFNPTSTTVFITDTPAVTQTFVYTQTLIASSTTIADMHTASVTPIVTIESTTTPKKVFVVLNANKNSGKPPLNIRLDARDSYLLEPNGTRLSCRGGPCFYTWIVYANGQQMGKAENNSIGTFEYTFGQNGVYTVTVVVCRGRDKIDCAGSGTQVVVSR